jgi:4a-hydroxytetrahydrobiopterin dehydratase
MALAEKKEIAAFLETNDDWMREGDSLVAEITLKDFNQAMGFINRVALAAEKADHHPDIDIRWNKVRLVLSTHSEGGITQKDFDLGATISEFL